MSDIYQQLEIVRWVSNAPTQTVFGVGHPNADLMIIGEAPGFHEGEPFAGNAEQLLTAMIKSIGFTRDDVCITSSCTPLLLEQIKMVQPKLLLVVGGIAAEHLLGTKATLESLRGTLHVYGEQQTPLIVTYHPADLLKNPADKKKAFVDLMFVREKLTF